MFNPPRQTPKNLLQKTTKLNRTFGSYIRTAKASWLEVEGLRALFGRWAQLSFGLGFFFEKFRASGLGFKV